MKRKSSPLTTLVLIVLVAAVAVGAMEYLRREQERTVDSLAQKVAENDQRIADVNQREKALEPLRPYLEFLSAHMADGDAGYLSSQRLMALVDASRTAQLQLQATRFGKPDTASFERVMLSGSVQGTESEVLAFVAAVEDEQPFGHFERFVWQGTVDGSASPSINQSGLTFEFAQYGP